MGETSDRSVSLDAAIRATLAARPIARDLQTDDDRARANAWMIRMQNAVLAVLEQHKPRALTADECFMRRVLPKTVICLGPDHRSGSILDETYYPCRTVRAIASALTIEASA